jgi:glycosyltransferase involved in cell wall biosynthesis
MAHLVSILIPAYNAEHWIRETIKSALNQTWPNKELIIVNDGSTDNTLQIAKDFESKLVKVVSQENKGASAARNKAFSLAQGDYIQWLDADDLLAPDKILNQLRSIENVTNTNVLLSSSFGTFYFRPEKAKFRPNSLWQDLDPLQWILNRFIDYAWMSQSVWLVSRRLSNMAGPWDERLSLNDDGEYFLRVVAASEKVKFVPKSNCYYRAGNYGSQSKMRSDKSLESLLLSVSLSISYLLSLEDSERTRGACLIFLENILWYFYPGKKELQIKVHNLAKQFGVERLNMRESRKYLLVGKIFGWHTAKIIRNILYGPKIFASRNLDRLFYILDSRRY